MFSSTEVWCLHTLKGICHQHQFTSHIRTGGKRTLRLHFWHHVKGVIEHVRACVCVFGVACVLVRLCLCVWVGRGGGWEAGGPYGEEAVTLLPGNKPQIDKGRAI